MLVLYKRILYGVLYIFVLLFPFIALVFLQYWIQLQLTVHTIRAIIYSSIHPPDQRDIKKENKNYEKYD